MSPRNKESRPDVKTRDIPWDEVKWRHRALKAEADRARAVEALHQWLGAYAAGYFENIARTRRDTVREIVKNSNAALAVVPSEPEETHG